MIYLTRPEAFLLALPLLLALRRRLLGPTRLSSALRIAVLALALLVVAGPVARLGRPGRDLVIALDRSRSAPDGLRETANELLQLAREQRRTGDRIGVVLFGGDARVAAALAPDLRELPADLPVEPDETDLAGALETAAGVIPTDRQGAVLLLSDGDQNRGRAREVALRLAARGVRVHARAVRRPGLVDAYVEDLAPPAEVDRDAPFWIPAWVRANAPLRTRYELSRDGHVVARGTIEAPPGRRRLVLSDRVAEPGIHTYELRLLDLEDRVPENDLARAVVRVLGLPRILCVTPRGRSDRLTRSLHLSGLAVQVRAPRRAPLHLDGLDQVRAVVLENVPAADLPTGSLGALKRYCEELGGGVLLTGGKASFGRGGYRRTDLEKILPVSLEVRREHRRFDIAMAIVLDRSGSMGMPVGGRTKMDLADEGAVAAIELMGKGDQVAVIAVDSAPTVVVPLSAVTDPAALAARARSITAGGGGIYMGVGVHAAWDALQHASASTRHIVVFADAADAEEPADLDTFVPELAAKEVTLSIIGLGSPTDSDAALLQRLAALGNGRCVFCQSAAELPRVFAQEAIQAMKASFVEEPTPVDALPPLARLGAVPRPLPRLGGYSVAYPRPEAEVAILTRDDKQLPVLALWEHGLGRAAAFTGEADGRYSGELAGWPGYADLFAPLGRWLAGAKGRGDLFGAVRREKSEAVVTVEAAPGAEALLALVRGKLVRESGPSAPLRLRRVGPRRLEARVPLRGAAVLRPVLELPRPDGGRSALPLASVILPQPLELRPPRDPRQGERLLRRIANLTGGRFEPRAEDLWLGPRQSRALSALAPWCALAALFLMVLEIGVRRLGLKLPRGALAAAWQSVRRGRRRKARAALTPDYLAGEAAGDGPVPAPDAPRPRRGGARAPKEGGDMASAVARARKRVERRLR